MLLKSAERGAPSQTVSTSGATSPSVRAIADDRFPHPEQPFVAIDVPFGHAPIQAFAAAKATRVIAGLADDTASSRG